MQSQEPRGTHNERDIKNTLGWLYGVFCRNRVVRWEIQVQPWARRVRLNFNNAAGVQKYTVGHLTLVKTHFLRKDSG